MADLFGAWVVSTRSEWETWGLCDLLRRMAIECAATWDKPRPGENAAAKSREATDGN